MGLSDILKKVVLPVAAGALFSAATGVLNEEYLL